MNELTAEQARVMRIIMRRDLDQLQPLTFDVLKDAAGFRGFAGFDFVALVHDLEQAGLIERENPYVRPTALAQQCTWNLGKKELRRVYRVTECIVSP